MNIKKVKNKMNKKKKDCLIIDIDNTICKPKDEYKIDIPQSTNREDWDNFLIKRKYYDPIQFKPIKEIVKLIDGIMSLNPDVFIFFVTARENIQDKPIYLNTFRLIRKIFKSLNDPKLLGRKYKILMREENDFRTNTEIKKEILHDIEANYNPILAIDDEEENIKMFENHGILCIRVCNREDIIK